MRLIQLTYICTLLVMTLHHLVPSQLVSSFFDRFTVAVTAQPSEGLGGLFHWDASYETAIRATQEIAQREAARQARLVEEAARAQAGGAEGGISSGARPAHPSASSAAYSTHRVAPPPQLDIESLYYENLPLSELEEHFSTPPPATASIVQQISAISSKFYESNIIDVILIGFNGDGDTKLVLDTNELQRYLAQVGLNGEQIRRTVQGLKKDGSTTSSSGSSSNENTELHDLPFATKYLFRIKHSSPALKLKLQTKLASTVEMLVESNPYIISAAESNRHPRKANAKTKKPPVIPTIPIPAYLINDILSKDFQETGLQTTLYLMNLEPVYLKEETQQHQPQEDREPRSEKVRLRYVYTQESEPYQPVNATAVGGIYPPSPFASLCPTTHWISGQQRFVWFDLSAGPIAYGPQSWGDGFVTEYSLPNLARMLERQVKDEKQLWSLAKIPGVNGAATLPEDAPFIPPTTLNNHYKHTLLSELSLLVSKITKTLFVPAVHHWPVPHAQKLKIHLIFVHERHYGESRVETAEEIAAAAEKKDPTKKLNKKGEFISGSIQNNVAGDEFDAAAEEAAWSLYPDDHSGPSAKNNDGWSEWREIEEELLNLGLPNQRIEIHNHHLRFEDCEQCVAAYTHSLRTHATNTMVDGHTGRAVDASTTHTVLRSTVNHYLDSTELKDWLEQFETTFWDMKETKKEAKRDTGGHAIDDEDDQRVIRVFIYDLATENILLLDRFHQSVAFEDDLVVAVQSRAYEAMVDFNCDGRSLAFDPSDASRSTLGSILTATYGILPTFQQWAPHLNNTEHDFLFTLGMTPYGYFSTDKHLSFALKDAASDNNTSE